MITKTIKYEDFDGNQVEDDFAFHLSKTEFLRYEVAMDGGLVAGLTRMTTPPINEQQLFAFFEELIITCYGVKSDDGKKFIKNDGLREEFKCSAAYDAMVMEFVTDANAAGDFVAGIMPSDVQEAAKEEVLKQKMAGALGTKPKTTAEIDAELTAAKNETPSE